MYIPHVGVLEYTGVVALVVTGQQGGVVTPVLLIEAIPGSGWDVLWLLRIIHFSSSARRTG